MRWLHCNHSRFQLMARISVVRRVPSSGWQTKWCTAAWYFWWLDARYTSASISPGENSEEMDLSGGDFSLLMLFLTRLMKFSPMTPLATRGRVKRFAFWTWHWCAACSRLKWLGDSGKHISLHPPCAATFTFLLCLFSMNTDNQVLL